MNNLLNKPAFEYSFHSSEHFIGRAENLYSEIISKQRGRIAFLAGDYGSGRSEMLRSKKFHETTSAEIIADVSQKGLMRALVLQQLLN